MNWRAVLAFLVSVCPNIPGMAANVNPALSNSIGGAGKMYDIFYLWGYGSAFLVYVVLSKVFPATETLIPATIHEDEQVVNGQVWITEEVQTQKTLEGEEKGGSSGAASL